MQCNKSSIDIFSVHVDVVWLKRLGGWIFPLYLFFHILHTFRVHFWRLQQQYITKEKRQIKKNLLDTLHAFSFHFQQIKLNLFEQYKICTPTMYKFVKLQYIYNVFDLHYAHTDTYKSIYQQHQQKKCRIYNNIWRERKTLYLQSKHFVCR